MNKVFLPISIIVAGLIIAGGVLIISRADNAGPQIVENERPAFEISPITDNDHIRGNPNAEILIIEYSDFECPFCARFHGTMTRVIDEYVDTGKVAWVYRHFPLQDNKDARFAAEASECVAKLGGEDKFWNFSGQIYADQENNLKTDQLKEIAISLDIDESEYDKCVNNRETKDRVEKDYQDGLKIAKLDANFGTPYNILMPKNAEMIPLGGAVPYSTIKQIIEAVLEVSSKGLPESI